MKQYWPEKVSDERASSISTAAWNVCDYNKKLHDGGATVGEYWTVRYPLTTIEDFKHDASLAIFTGGGLEIHLKASRSNQKWWDSNWAVFKNGELIYHTPLTDLWKPSEGLPEVLEVIDEHWDGNLLEAALAIEILPTFVEAAQSFTSSIGHNFIRNREPEEEFADNLENRFEALLLTAEYLNGGEEFLETLNWRERRKYKYWLNAFDKISERKTPEWSPPTKFYLIMGSILFTFGLIIRVEVLIGYGVMFLLAGTGFIIWEKTAKYRKAKKAAEEEASEETETAAVIELAPVSGAKEDVNPEQSLFDALDAAERGTA